MIFKATINDSPSQLAADIFTDVFRNDFAGSGFALIQFSGVTASSPFRSYMVSMQQELNAQVAVSRKLRLRFQSLARFDQQTTTKFHLDGGPEESILMLGYEPTDIRSEIALADYTKAAFDLGLTPQEFMDSHNPMFVRGERLLQPYIRRLDAFNETQFQIVFVNNGRLPWTSGGTHSLGVLHQATILNPDATKSRVINSTMMGVGRPGCSLRIRSH